MTEDRKSKAPTLLTPKQKQVLDFLSFFTEQNGYAPSQQEIARHCGSTALAGTCPSPASPAHEATRKLRRLVPEDCGRCVPIARFPRPGVVWTGPPG